MIAHLAGQHRNKLPTPTPDVGDGEACTSCLSRSQHKSFRAKVPMIALSQLSSDDSIQRHCWLGEEPREVK